MNIPTWEEAKPVLEAVPVELRPRAVGALIAGWTTGAWPDTFASREGAAIQVQKAGAGWWFIPPGARSVPARGLPMAVDACAGLKPYDTSLDALLADVVPAMASAGYGLPCVKGLSCPVTGKARQWSAVFVDADGAVANTPCRALLMAAAFALGWDIDTLEATP